MNAIVRRLVYLHKVRNHYDAITKWHRDRVDILKLTNPEQAGAQLGRCLFWLERSERIRGKIRELADVMDVELKKRYRRA